MWSSADWALIEQYLSIDGRTAQSRFVQAQKRVKSELYISAEYV